MMHIDCLSGGERGEGRKRRGERHEGMTRDASLTPEVAENGFRDRWPLI